jgi:hypothetical protein
MQPAGAKAWPKSCNQANREEYEKNDSQCRNIKGLNSEKQAAR